MSSPKPQKRPPPPPRTHLENEDIRCVASPYSAEGITAPVASAELKQVLLERLRKEITSKLGRSMCRSSGSSGVVRGKKRKRGGSDDAPNEKVEKVRASDVPVSVAESVVRSRFVVGINQCTRALEGACKRRSEQQPGTKAAPTPSLILLARDVRPASILAHISVYAHILRIPTLILPGKASVEMGKALGIRSVAAAVFLSSPGEGGTLEDGHNTEEWMDAQGDVDSFVKYVKSKIPK